MRDHLKVKKECCMEGSVGIIECLGHWQRVVLMGTCISAETKYNANTTASLRHTKRYQISQQNNRVKLLTLTFRRLHSKHPFLDL
jgi:hypothetical protein